MPTTISIQGSISYGLIPVWILGILLVLPFILNRIKRKKKSKAPVETVTKKPEVIEVPYSVKGDYVNQLEGILSDYRQGNRDSKDCYQLLSIKIRHFLKDYAGLDITTKTLAEIRGMHLTKIESMIEEIYDCEFAPDKNGDVEKAVMKTIENIKNW